MKKINLIEGLRGYLALWVFIDHLLASSGYSVEKLNGLFKMLRSGWYAVDVFIIISGFVIFYLLDNNEESYLKYIARRFFRLWPLFIILFFISIPISLLNISNFNEFSLAFPDLKIGDGLLVEKINSWWENIGLHILVHSSMLHGIFPTYILSNSPGAFLTAAWSISLEWQFYIIAPIIFSLLKKGKQWWCLLFYFFCALIFFLGKQITSIEFGAFLPMHIEFFFIGGVSYFFYKYFSNIFSKITFLPIISVVAFFLFFNSDCNFNLLPYVIWLVFYSLLLDVSNPQQRNYISVISYLFTNRVILYLGKISYSIYLAHLLIIVLVQYVILNLFPSLSQKVHLIILSIGSILMTVIISHFTYKYIELFFTNKGKLIINKITA